LSDSHTMKHGGGLATAPQQALMQLRFLVAFLLQSGAGALRTGARSHQHLFRLLDAGHVDIQSWCNTTLPLQSARQNGLQVLLQKAEQAAEQDTELAQLRQEVQSLAAEAEAFQSRMLEERSREAELREKNGAAARMADIDVKVLSSARDRFLQGDMSKTLLARGADASQELFNVRKQLTDLLAAAEKRANRLKVEERNSSNLALATGQGTACGPCQAKQAAEARLQDAEHEYRSAKRSLALSASALQEEAVYLTDVQSICSADSSVYQRLYGSQLRLLRQVLESGPTTSKVAMPSTVEVPPPATVAPLTTAATTVAPVATTVAAVLIETATTAARTTLAAASSTAAQDTSAPESLDVGDEQPAAAASAPPVTDAPTEDVHSTDDDTTAVAATAAPPTPRPLPAKKATASKQAAKKKGMVNPSSALGMLQQALQSPAGTDPSLPNQYAVWSPTDPSASSTALTQETETQNAGASWATDFKKELMGDMDGDDGDGTTAAPQHARRGHHKHRHGKSTTTAAAVTSVAPTSDPDDMDLTFPTVATTASPVQDDDDLKPQKAPDLGGGLESFLASHSTGHHAKAEAAAPTKSDSDLQIIQNLYTADGHLPTQYTAWSPSLVQLASASSSKTARVSAEDVAGYLLQEYARHLNSKALSALSKKGSINADGVEAAIEAFQTDGQENTTVGEAAQWCTLFLEKERTASPVLEPLHRHENTSISAIQAEAQLAALHEELDTRMELKKSVSGDIEELEKLLQKQQDLVKANSSATDSSYAVAVEAMQAIHQEVLDALQDAVQRRKTAAAAQEASLAELKQELEKAQTAADGLKSGLKESASLLQTSRAQVSGIRKTCDKAQHASLMHQQQAEDEAHALGIVSVVLQ